MAFTGPLAVRVSLCSDQGLSGNAVLLPLAVHGGHNQRTTVGHDSDNHGVPWAPISRRHLTRNSGFTRPDRLLVVGIRHCVFRESRGLE